MEIVEIHTHAWNSQNVKLKNTLFSQNIQTKGKQGQARHIPLNHSTHKTLSKILCALLSPLISHCTAVLKCCSVLIPIQNSLHSPHCSISLFPGQGVGLSLFWVSPLQVTSGTSVCLCPGRSGRLEDTASPIPVPPLLRKERGNSNSWYCQLLWIIFLQEISS